MKLIELGGGGVQDCTATAQDCLLISSAQNCFAQVRKVKGDLADLTVRCACCAENLTGSTTPYSCFPKLPFVPERCDSDICFQCLTSWLQDCLENHPRCLSLEPGAKPKRSIYVDETHVPPRPRLKRLGSSCPPFVTLSHCWGKKSLVKTIMSSLLQYENGIPWDSPSNNY
jgi:hypothetical protein